VQFEAIPPLMAGSDVVTQALTGTGKTAAFAIPLIEAIDRERPGPQAVILAPTRELALQVAAEVQRLGRHNKVHVVAIYGGQSYEVQLRALRRGVDVVVATPGRLMDHIRSGKIDLSQVRTLVLDEADEMLNMGFLEDVEFVMAQMPEGRQTALFSATMPPAITALAQRYMTSPVNVRLAHRRSLTAPSVDHSYYLVPFKHKFDALVRLLHFKRPERTLIFGATKRIVDELVQGLQDCGFEAELIHSDISQPQRERVMGAFRSGRLPILVATDVAARGIDVDNVTHVVNFDMPNDVEYYIHRIGRTGRIGRRGEALSLVSPWEERQVKVLEQATGAKIVRGELPSEAELAERALAVLREQLAGRIGQAGQEPYRALAESLSASADPLDVAAAALALVAGGAKEAIRHVELAGELAAGMVPARRFERQRGPAGRRKPARFDRGGGGGGYHKIRPSHLWHK
jgi:ATP-dependent RNA helicase DeaD